jgi:hypothetical protein
MDVLSEADFTGDIPVLGLESGFTRAGPCDFQTLLMALVLYASQAPAAIHAAG